MLHEHVQQHLANSENMPNRSLSLPSFREFIDGTFSSSSQHISNIYSNRVVSSSPQQYSTTTLPTNEVTFNTTKLMSTFQNTNTITSKYQTNSIEDRFKVDACVVDVHGDGKTNWKSTSPLTVDSGNDPTLNNDHAGILSSKIMSLESKLNMQELELSRLMHENESLKKKRKLEVIGTSVSAPSSKKKSTKQQQTHSNSISKTFNLILENDISEKYQDIITGKLEEYKVLWESEEYVILNAFNNRDEIFNYYCPLYESKFPEKEKMYRLVLERDDYKKLFKENKHLTKFFKSHAWRISIFSIEFFNFVRKSKKMKVY